MFIRTKLYKDFIPSIEIRQLILLAKKLLPYVVFNMASLESNPFKFPEVQTLVRRSNDRWT